AEPDRSIPHRRGAGSDRGLGAAALRRDRQPFVVKAGAGLWALPLAVPYFLHACAGRLSQAALSEMAGRADRDGMVGGGDGGPAAPAPYRVLVRPHLWLARRRDDRAFLFLARGTRD